MSIKDKLEAIKKELPDNVTLVAVSKTKSAEEIMEAYDTGHRDFGENKIQEMSEKWEALPKDIRWHMIGHVQRNKVKYMASYVHLIHGVDSLKLLREIDKRGKQNNRIIPCLLQIHIARESSKFGFDEGELETLISSNALRELPHVSVEGFMGMATFTDDMQRVRGEFRQLKSIYDHWKARQISRIHILSMGMSGDYKIALEEGSTMVRIGSSIFGARKSQ